MGKTRGFRKWEGCQAQTVHYANKGGTKKLKGKSFKNEIIGEVVSAPAGTTGFHPVNKTGRRQPPHVKKERAEKAPQPTAGRKLIRSPAGKRGKQKNNQKGEVVKAGPKRTGTLHMNKVF